MLIFWWKEIQNVEWEKERKSDIELRFDLELKAFKWGHYKKAWKQTANQQWEIFEPNLDTSYYYLVKLIVFVVEMTGFRSGTVAFES